MKDEGRTILFVTHDMAAVARFCDRAMLLERGRVELIGEPGAVGARYVERNFARQRDAQPDDEARTGPATARAEIVDAWFEEDGQRTDVLHQGDAVHASRCACASTSRCDDPIIAFLIENDRAPPAVRDLQRGRRRRAPASTRRATRRRSACPSTTCSRPAACSSRRGCSRTAERRSSTAGALRHGDGHGDARLRRPGQPARRRMRYERARAGVGVSAHADRRPVGARRQPPPLRLPGGHARGHRLQAALLRLGARLPVAARPAAAAVRRPLLRLHPLREDRRGGDLLSGRAAGQHRPLPRSSRTGRAPSDSLVDRENLVRKIQFPRAAVPVAVVLTAGFNLAAQPARGARLRARVRRARRTGRGSRRRCSSAPSRCWSSASRCCSRRSTSATATSSRSGRSCSSSLFYATPVIYAIETIDIDATAQAGADAQPAGRDPRAVPPRGDRPDGALSRGGGGRRASGCCADRDHGRRRSCSAGASSTAPLRGSPRSSELARPSSASERPGAAVDGRRAGGARAASTPSAETARRRSGKVCAASASDQLVLVARTARWSLQAAARRSGSARGDQQQAAGGEHGERRVGAAGAARRRRGAPTTAALARPSR